MKHDELLELLRKYDVPAPRYTSYPTVPYWEPETLTTDKWISGIRQTYEDSNNELCLYIHLPYCENLCTFCACNKRITVNHKVEDPYIDAVLKEWQLYKDTLGKTPVIREIHLGGGTPTFFSPENLERLISGILKSCTVANDYEFSIEVHPNYTNEKHLETLAKLGFNRISLGVQDFDPLVQMLINRVQSFERTMEVVEWAHKHNYKSTNIDIIYGLPKQSLESVELTMANIALLDPDRIAFYSYAHVPWKSKGQRRYTEADLPDANLKWDLYQKGRESLITMGFESIGMDHFAKPNDKMFTSMKVGKLHRNFMGYTTTDSKLLIGLGCSSIGDAWTAFAQNEKEVETYLERVNKGEFPIVNGHNLNAEDLIIRQNILDLMCRSETVLDQSVYADQWSSVDIQLREFAQSGLIEYTDSKIRLLEKGRLFVRNVCAAIDLRLRRNNPKSSVFSKAI